MENPVVAADGHSYEKDSIISWFKKGHITSPLTNTKLKNKKLIDNFALKKIILTF